MSGLFTRALARKNTGRPPVWFMRQAGRYHAHYQALRKQYSFIELCKKPEVACEVTMGPIRDFDFDAAILFSDLLFPLEAMGMGLRYDEGPKLDWHLRELGDLQKLQGGLGLLPKLQFQGEAMRLVRAALPREKGLLGFVGGPLTLFYYAVEGSHQGELAEAKRGLTDGRFAGFRERLQELLAANMALQADAGADTVAIFDTCAGEIDAKLYGEVAVPAIKWVIERFKSLSPGKPVVYYSRGTGPDHWNELRRQNVPIDVLGVDWRHDLSQVLREYGGMWAIQGNFDQHFLFLQPAELEYKLREFFRPIKELPERLRSAWICGLGHGVMPGTPEASVKLFIELQREIFGS